MPASLVRARGWVGGRAIPPAPLGRVRTPRGREAGGFLGWLNKEEPWLGGKLPEPPPELTEAADVPRDNTLISTPDASERRRFLRREPCCAFCSAPALAAPPMVAWAAPRGVSTPCERELADGAVRAGVVVPLLHRVLLGGESTSPAADISAEVLATLSGRRINPLAKLLPGLRGGGVERFGDAIFGKVTCEVDCDGEAAKLYAVGSRSMGSLVTLGERPVKGRTSSPMFCEEVACWGEITFRSSN